MASAHRSCARRVGVAARGMAGLRPTRDSTLGCAGHQCAGARLVSGVRTERHSGSQKCSPWRCSGSLHTKAQHVGRFTGTSHGDGEHKDMEGPGAVSRRGRPQAHLASLRPRHERAVVRGHSRACARAAMLAWCSHLAAKGTARDEAAAHPSIPAQETTARRPVPNTFLARRRRRPRGRTAQEPPPSRYGSPATRWPASRHDLEGDASQRRRIITGK
jgi:hypothetical protein